LLLDRRRIKRWAKWIALFLAIAFGAGFLFLGVGYGGAGLNVSDAFSCANENTVATADTPEARIAAFEQRLQQDPNDVEALLGLATIYQNDGQLTVAAGYLEQVIVIDPSQKDIYLRLANIYLNNDVLDYDKAKTVLIKLTSLDPNNPDVYLKLGIAQRELGETEAAILAWQRYLQLDPNGDMADVIREQIDALSKKGTTTTTSGGTGSTETGGAAPGSSATTSTTG
jgi:cytochrome c-type biogenesis protein CcmH/NrfG